MIKQDWYEIDQSADVDDELSFQVPNGIWAGWLSLIFIKGQDLASFLRSVGWRVELPASSRRPS